MMMILFDKTEQSRVRTEVGALEPGDLGLSPSSALGSYVTLGKFFHLFQSPSPL